jgi:hypothetical protein
MKFVRHIAIFGLVVMAMYGCATQKPVLMANTHLMNVGTATAAQDVDHCMEYAKAGSEGPQKYEPTPVANAATSSVVGAAAGGASGAVFGNAGAGAAAGAIGGVVGSLTHALIDGAFRAKPPEPMIRHLTENCLRQKGYEPAGWR